MHFLNMSNDVSGIKKIILLNNFTHLNVLNGLKTLQLFGINAINSSITYFNLTLMNQNLINDRPAKTSPN